MRGRIDHIGVVVNELETAAEFLREVLGLELKLQPPPAAPGVNIAFYGWEGARVELIQLDDPQARAARLGGATARLEHIAIEVPDVDEAAAELTARGVRFTSDRPIPVRDLRALWTEPESSAGIAWQIFSRAGHD